MGFQITRSFLDPLLLSILIFLGPSVQQILNKDSFSVEINWISFRNLVGAPIFEEIVFRSCIVTILRSTGMRDNSLIFYSPLFFGFGIQ